MTIPVSVDVASSTFTANARFPFIDNQQVYIESRIPNQVPAPLVEYDSAQCRVLYYIAELDGNEFRLSAAEDGEPITLTSAGIGQITVSEFPPLTWDALEELPLLDVSELRDFFTTPESIIQLSAAPDTPIGVTVSSSIFTSGIPHNLIDGAWPIVRFNSTDTVPAPLVAGVNYYAMNIQSDTEFMVSLVIGGTPITITDSGEGQISFQNYTLNVVLEKRIRIAMGDVYDALLLKVSNHMRFVSNAWWYWYAPPSGEPINAQFYPAMNRALIVCDNLQNPERLRKAIRDYATWNMIQDASWRNLIKDSTFFEQFGSDPESKAKKRAEQRLNEVAPLLQVAGYQGARRLFDFDQVSNSISVSLI